MTERHKQIAIVSGTILVALFLLLFFRKGAGAGGTVGASDWTLPTVTGPSLGPIYFGDGDRPVINIPGLNLGGPDLSMIGACCSDCGQSQVTTFNQRPGPTYVFNAGNQGPNVYSYTTVNQTQQQSSGGFTGIPWASR